MANAAKILTLALVLLLSPVACQAPAFNPDSPLSRVPLQSTLVLHEDLTIKANTVSLWFQQGEQIPEKLLDHYQPHCKFETYKMQAADKPVRADRFSIHNVVRWDDYAMLGVQLAAVTIGIGTFGSGDDASPVNMATEMFLHSEQQPDVYRLVCSQWNDATTGEHVTINEIRHALGEYFSLKMPG